MFQRLTKLAVVAVVAAGLFLGAGAARAEMTKEQVEQIVHDYLASHADVILQSVDDYQRKEQQKRQSAALQTNREELFNNEKSPIIGNPEGDVTLIEFFDYNCHYCKQIFPDIKSLAETDKNLKIIFKDLPILGPTSETSAKWALAAHLQGKYFPFHQKMMEHKGPIKDEDLEKAAKDVGLDVDRAKKDIDGTEVLLQIERNRSLANQMNFHGTPSFVVGEQAFAGALDKKELVQRIKEARENKAASPEEKKDQKPE